MGADLRRAPRAREDCEAACYNCLMSYVNQPDHRLLDRQRIRHVLLRLAGAHVEASPAALPRTEHLARLKRQCQSNLERDWLDFLDTHGYRLPTQAQSFIDVCRKKRDKAQTDCLEDYGYTVIRFDHRDAWEAMIKQHPNIFGRMA
jgi:very-short-patch-repair endonuclease